jgi:signal transduction histidine kinase
MRERRWRLSRLFWRLTASYFVATLITAFVVDYVGRFEGPFGALRDNDVVVFFARIGSNNGNSALLFILLASVVGVLTGLLISGNLTRRFRQIMSAVQSWSRGEFAAKARIAGSDELGVLAHDLNHMADQIQDLLTTRQALAVVEERNRLARDLHDTVKQQVFANALLVRAARKQLTHDPATALKHLEAAEALSEQTQQELITLIRALRPPALADKGLADMVRDFGDEWSRQMGIAVELRLQGERETPLAIEETLFRVIQEALANVARHSGAHAVNIHLEWEPDRIHLRVQDDGTGFDAARPPGNGVGLANMRERVETAQGRFCVESSPAGTVVEASIPLMEDK